MKVSFLFFIFFYLSNLNAHEKELRFNLWEHEIQLFENNKNELYVIFNKSKQLYYLTNERLHILDTFSIRSHLKKPIIASYCSQNIVNVNNHQFYTGIFKYKREYCFFVVTIKDNRFYEQCVPIKTKNRDIQNYNKLFVINNDLILINYYLNCDYDNNYPYFSRWLSIDIVGKIDIIRTVQKDDYFNKSPSNYSVDCIKNADGYILRDDKEGLYFLKKSIHDLTPIVFDSTLNYLNTNFDKRIFYYDKSENILYYLVSNLKGTCTKELKLFSVIFLPNSKLRIGESAYKIKRNTFSKVIAIENGIIHLLEKDGHIQQIPLLKFKLH